MSTTPTASSNAPQTPGVSVASRAELSALIIPVAQDGLTVYVAEAGNRAPYVFDNNAGTAIDGTTVLATSRGGNSRWTILESGAPPAAGPFTFADAVPADKSNIQTLRLHPRAIDTTKHGVNSFASDTTNALPANNGNFTTQGGGDQNSTQGDFSTVAGGILNIASGASSTVCGGDNNTASGTGSTCLGGEVNTASALASVAMGNQAKASRTGQVAHAAGNFAAQGDAQSSEYIVKGTDVAAAGTILLDEAGAQLALVNGFAYRIKAVCIANRTGTGDRASFEHTLLAHATAGAAVIDNDNTDLMVPNGTAWTIAFTAVGANIVATFTGTAGQTVRAMVVYSIQEVGGGV